MTATLRYPLPRPFGKLDNVWNAKLLPDAPLTGETHDLDKAAAARAATINSSKYGSSIWIVDQNTPCVTVALLNSKGQPDTTTYNAALRVLLKSVPLPVDFTPALAVDNDAAVEFYDIGKQQVWALWKFRQNAESAWTCRFGGRASRVNEGNGFFTDRHTSYKVPKDRTTGLPKDPALAAEYENMLWGCTATSAMLCAGSIMAEDLARGEILHGLGLSLPANFLGPGFRSPARRGDGGTAGAIVKEGWRFRLPADHVPSCSHIVARMIERAARDYGLIVWDNTGLVSNGGCLAFRAEPGIGSYYEGTPSYNVLKGFPWADLQVLA